MLDPMPTVQTAFSATRRGPDAKLPTLPYELDAMNNMPMPDGLGMADQWMYQSLALLYARYREHRISLDDAKREKSALLDSLKHMKFREDSGSLWSTIICKTDVARMNYRKNRTLENADALIEAIEGLPIPVRNKED